MRLHQTQNHESLLSRKINVAEQLQRAEHNLLIYPQLSIKIFITKKLSKC